MAELHIYRGLQGSGKSTLADTLALLDGGRRAGRDRVRELIGVKGLGSSAQEKEVTVLQGQLISNGLNAGQNVHVDDMNLKNKYVARLVALAEKHGAEVVVHDLTNVPLETCLERNRERNAKSGFVNEDVIRSNHRRFIKGRPYPLPMPEKSELDPRLMPPEPYVPDVDEPKAFLVDLDGTTALKWEGRGFHDYDERVFYDHPNEPVIQVVRSLKARGWTPIYVSGRKGYDSCRTATHAWITKHIDAGAHWLYMREPHDNRPDWIVKNEIFDKFIRVQWNVQLALDDRNQVVDRYRQMGLTVLQVAPGDF